MVLESSYIEEKMEAAPHLMILLKVTLSNHAMRKMKYGTPNLGLSQLAMKNAEQTPAHAFCRR